MPVVIERRGVEFQELAAVVTELHLLQQFIGDREQCLLHTRMILHRYILQHIVNYEKNKKKTQTKKPESSDNWGSGNSPVFTKIESLRQFRIRNQPSLNSAEIASQT